MDRADILIYGWALALLFGLIVYFACRIFRSLARLERDVDSLQIQMRGIARSSSRN